MEISLHRQVAHLDEKVRPQAMFTSAISPDGRTLATGALDSTISLWRLPGCTPLSTNLSRHEGAVLTIRFSPVDGDTFASCGDDKTVLVWRGQLVAEEYIYKVQQRLMAVHTSDVTALEWTADGRCIVTGSLDRTVAVFTWDADKKEFVLACKTELPGFVKGLAIHGNTLIIVQSDDQTARLYRLDAMNDQSKLTLIEYPNIIKHCFINSSTSVFFSRPSFSADGQLVALTNASNGLIPCACLISVDAFKGGSDGEHDDDDDSSIYLIGHYGPIEVARFSPVIYKVGQLVCVGGQDGTVSLWSSTCAHPLFVLTDLCDQSVTDICWSPDGQFLFVSFYEGSFVAKVSLMASLTGPISRFTVKSASDEQQKDESFVIKLPSMNPSLAIPSNRDGRKRVTPMLLSVKPANNIIENSAIRKGQVQQLVVKFEGLPVERFPVIQKKIAFHFDLKLLAHGIERQVRMEANGTKVQCCDVQGRIFWRETLRKPCIYAAANNLFAVFLTTDFHMIALDLQGRRALPHIILTPPPFIVKLSEGGEEGELVIVLTNGQMIIFSANLAQVSSTMIPEDIKAIHSLSLYNSRVVINGSYVYVLDGAAAAASGGGGVWMMSHDQQSLNDLYCVKESATITDVKRMLKLYPDQHYTGEHLSCIEEQIALCRLLGDVEEAGRWSSIYNQLTLTK